MDAKTKKRLLRLVNLLGLIKDRSGVKAGQLAAQCGVSVRTFFRDLRILEKSGFPVLYRRGYRIFSNFSLDPLNLTLDEVLTIRAGCRNLLYYLQYSDSAEAVLKKIEKILLHKSGGLVKVLESDKEQPTLFEMLQDSPDLFGILKTALAGGQAVITVYHDESGRFVEDVFWPEALTCKEAGWSFEGRHYKTGEAVSIPFERIQKVTPSNLKKNSSPKTEAPIETDRPALPGKKKRPSKK
jgi:predicted DNA-binding transcriptional regulator YafY